MSRNKVTRQEFLAIKASLKNGLSTKEVQDQHGRGGSIVRRVKLAKSWPAYQASNQALRDRRKSDGLLDSNLTKEQAQAFLEMQTQLETVKGERDAHKDRADRLEARVKVQAGTIREYQQADLQRSIQKARRSRSILAMFQRDK
ncbi:hypothetical protein [Pseudarthrobacter sp. ATCC 49987]|uniref:hypothetical protein n=1 Tax=Pseudarthrobacter sp. ATCC 49987 TaxID=2698204 RepID=UPI00136BFF32|nr:hypothetical protein [Pseudarthrobacter sp. ATCC 49987]